MVSGDVEDNLTFMARLQLGWMTGSHFTKGGIALSEFPEGFGWDVADVADFK
jgi:hypothetical protein